MRSPDRLYDLGEDGEEEAKKLSSKLRIGNHLEPIFLMAGPLARAEVRRRLQAADPFFEQVEPGVEVLERIEELAAADGKARRRVLWIEVEPVDVDAWLRLLVAFNRRREWLRDRAPWLMILAVPPATEELNLRNLCASHAPDFWSISGVAFIDSEPQLVGPPPVRPITWLHLSDFHFASREGWDRRPTLKALLKYLGERAEKGWSPDFIFATGDIAWSGRREEFEQAQLFFRALGESLRLSENEFRRRLFMIPGNHDVDRGAIGPIDDFMVAGLLGAEGPARQELLAKTMGDAATMRLLGRRLTEYYLFTERQLGAARRVPEERPWRVDFREVGGVEVAILQLNTACFSGPKDGPEKLLLGRHQVDEALAEASTARLRIVLQHHPFGFLADGREVMDRLRQPDGGHILLRGHLHDSEVEQTSKPDGSLIELAAGTVYSGTEWPKRFLIGAADLETGKATVEFFTYSPKGAGFWAADTLAYARAPQGVAVFELPSALRTAGQVATIGTSGQGARTRARNIRARYRLAVANVHGQMRFIGLPAVGGSRPNVGVQALFVPLRLRQSGQLGSEKKSLATAELLKRLEPNKKSGKQPKGRSRPHRFVVLGEPGSGKTTLCKFAAAHFAAAESTVEPLPLFLPFREYVRTCREEGDRSLVAFLAGQAVNHLQVGGIDEDWLEQVLLEGNVLLLLDGLDEVGSAAERGRMTDRVVAFCGQYLSLPVLVTSRFAGYDDAPLPARGFERLELLPFEDEDLRVFVSNWYAAQEPNDPLARQRGSADLLAALDAEPRVKALASNPLLATLIALLHRSEAMLPGERAKLYEKVVQLLLETWPGQARRSFREIDEGLQRSYLESFALERQKKRDQPEAKVSFRREELAESLADLHFRQAGVAAAVAKRQVEQWIDFLAAGTGILVEQQPGVFAFLHLSLLEYLAACALDREGEPLEEVVARSREGSVWRETLLLAVGRHATDLPFLERLFQRLQAKAAWFFLVSCLFEEVAFDAGKRTAILEAAGRRLLELRASEWYRVAEVLRTIERFSHRHREGVRSWRESRLSTGSGEAVRAAVALSFGPNQKAILQSLDRRPDREQVAIDLLEFWPGSAVGSWAVQQAQTERVPTFFESAAADVGSLRSLAALKPEVSDFVAIALSGQRLRTSRHFSLLALEAAAWLEFEDRAGGMGLPTAIQVQSGKDKCNLVVSPGWPMKLSEPKGVAIVWKSRDFARGFAQSFGWELVSNIARCIEQGIVTELDPNTEPSLGRNILDVVRDFVQDVALDSALDPKLGVVGHFELNVALQFSWYFTQAFAQELVRYFLGDSTLVIIPIDSVEERLAEPSPLQAALSVDREAWSQFVLGPLFEKFYQAEASVIARRVGEAWIALATTARRSREEAESYFSYRLQNLSLLYFWPEIDKMLPAEPSPEKLALYLELGWTQATTTHDWPGTPRWIALLEGEPPAHWLPRTHWHLCWLLFQPDATSHQEGFNAALREGLAETDVSLRAAAETLEREMGFFG